MLAQAQGRNRETIAHFEDALELNAQFGLKTNVIQTRCELAHTLFDSNTKTAPKQARSLLKQAQADARTLGLQRLFDDAERLLAEMCG